MNKKTDLETVGAMHQCKKGEAFSTCTHCGAMAEQLAKPCPHFMRQAGEMLEARASLSPPAAGQEPVAWRTFDGEGGYDYRTYDDNENYRAEWEQRNPNHKGWVEPLYAAPQPAVAAGWVMVPADPTLDMGWAYLDAARESEPFKTHSFNHDGYRAMLKAAPLPPAPSTEGERNG